MRRLPLRRLAVLSALATSLVGIGVTRAQSPEETIGTFTDWEVIRYTEAGAKVCAMWSDPTAAKSVPGRTEPHAFVAHRPDVGAYHEVSLQFGVNLQSNSTVVGTVGNQTFKLYTEGDGAWNPSTAEDLRMVKAMRRGAELSVSARTTGGVAIEDVYSLSGFTAAHRAMNEACGAKF